jgi:hypothetical protein
MQALAPQPTSVPPHMAGAPPHVPKLHVPVPASQISRQEALLVQVNWPQSGTPSHWMRQVVDGPLQLPPQVFAPRQSSSQAQPGGQTLPVQLPPPQVSTQQLLGAGPH